MELLFVLGVFIVLVGIAFYLTGSDKMIYNFKIFGFIIIIIGSVLVFTNCSAFINRNCTCTYNDRNIHYCSELKEAHHGCTCNCDCDGCKKMK